MDRLEKSAHHFRFNFDKSRILDSLSGAVSALSDMEKYRVRLLLGKSGECDITTSPLFPMDKPDIKITISPDRVNRNDPFLYHKTTNRDFYDKGLAACREKGFFDVIFQNQEDEITEGTISNIIIMADDNYYTPPVSSGLLNGVYRRYLLDNAGFGLKEKVLFKEDLVKADRIYIINSVRGSLPAVLV